MEKKMDNEMETGILYKVLSRGCNVLLEPLVVE